MNMKSKILLAALAIAGTSAAFAQPAAPAQHEMSTGNASAAMAMTAGEVRKVDLEQGKVTLKHEAITNLDMPPMTMVFRATDPAQLNGLKPGDKVRFHAESSNGAMVVTHIQVAQ